jgi:hypothetical protein
MFNAGTIMDSQLHSRVPAVMFFLSWQSSSFES